MPRKADPNPAPAAARPLYSVHPGVATVRKWGAELLEKTGRILEERVAYIREAGPPSGKVRRAWLRAESGPGTNVAGWLADRASGVSMGLAEVTPEGYLRAEGYVEAMFAGPKAGPRPIYDRLLSRRGRPLAECRV